MHLDPKAGRKLHEGALLDFMSGVRSLLAEVTEQRVNLANLPDDTFADLTKKRQLLADVQAKTKQLTLYADLIVGAALASSGKGGLWLTAAVLANEAATQGTLAEAEEQAKNWLATDQPDGALDRCPLHWPLVFPEVFDPARSQGPGFDAVIGNPPFLGGLKIKDTVGESYKDLLVNRIGRDVRGNRGTADLVAYFVLRSHALLNEAGQTGLVATNTLAQGDTRTVGLDQLIASGIVIRQAVKSKPWPSMSAVLEYAAIWTSRATLNAAAQCVADGVVVNSITPSLDPESRTTGKPQRLAMSAGIAFQGSNILGLGFTMEPERACELIEKSPRNKDVLFPYLNGQDLNTRPDCSASRWVINFHNWTEEKAKSYQECYEQVYSLVRPERSNNKVRSRREKWWWYSEYRRGLIDAISDFTQVIAITVVSKVVMPAMVPTGQVFSHMLGIFASDDTGMLALLSSAPHYWWTIERASTLETRIRYTPSDVFETFALPETTVEMRDLGDRLDIFRRELMLARQAGLTATYNLVHDQRCSDADIAELREIHRSIDEAVVRAYGWDDLLAAGLDHGFHDTRQGPRYTIGAVVRQEILDRLLELNHERYAAEVKAGLHDKRGRKRSAPASDTTLF
jgi:Eco57I restriction-modification methylase/MmeI, target recognition domain